MVSEQQRKTVNEHDYKDAEKDEIVQAPFGKNLKICNLPTKKKPRFSLLENQLIKNWWLDIEEL